MMVVCGPSAGAAARWRPCEAAELGSASIVHALRFFLRSLLGAAPAAPAHQGALLKAAMSSQPPKPRGLAQRGASCLGMCLRLFSILQLAAGAGYITVAVLLQFPPGDPLTL